MPTYTSGFTSFSSVGPGVLPWAAPSDAEFQDDIFAFCAAQPGGAGAAQSEFLICTGAIFSIPANERVTAITPRIWREALSDLPNAYTTDSAVYLIKNGVMQTSVNGALPGTWPMVNTAQDYTFPVTGWSRADFMTSGFGVAIACTCNSVSGFESSQGSIDYVEVALTTEILTPQTPSIILPPYAFKV